MPDAQLNESDVAVLLKESAGVHVTKADPDPTTTFEELGADSLAVLALVNTVESRYATSLPEPTAKVATVGEFLDVVNANLRK
jgi:minimal PKS acyl carrier protein